MKNLGLNLAIIAARRWLGQVRESMRKQGFPFWERAVDAASFFAESASRWA